VVTPPIAAQREGRLRHDVTRVTQLVANELEGLIRRAPDSGTCCRLVLATRELSRRAHLALPLSVYGESRSRPWR